MTRVSTAATALLGPDDPAPFRVREGRSPYVFVCDHAGRRIPRALGDLGVSAADLATHIAWDIGAAGLAQRLAEALDGSLVTQTYSRLVIDCNRPLGRHDSIPLTSADVPIPGNRELSPEARAQRVGALFQPYHDQIRRVLDRRAADGLPSILVTVHSFTEAPLFGRARPWHMGVLYREPGLARPLLSLLRAEAGLVVGDNEPYAAHADSDYSLVEHGEKRAIPNVELEIRQDLLADDAGQQAWADRLARLLPKAW